MARPPSGVSTRRPPHGQVEVAGIEPRLGEIFAFARRVLQSVFEGVFAVRLVIVDDEPVARLGFQAFFGNRGDFEVVAAVPCNADAAGVVAEQRPDVVIVDVANREDCRAVIASFRHKWRSTAVVVCSCLANSNAAIAALDAGASAVVSKAGDLENVAIAAQRAIRGDNYLDPDVASAVVSQMRADEARRKQRVAIALSHREEQVVRGLLKGGTNKEIANSLNLSEKTVKYYVGNLKDKFNAKNRLEIVISARDHFGA